MRRYLGLGLLVLLGAAGCDPAAARAPDAAAAAPPPTVLRVGHFPNVTHAQALVAHALTRRGRGWFEARLGTGVEIQWHVYNAGPSAMEAILAGALDVTYVGPNPALNAHLRSRGDEVRIIAGSAVGGAALVVPGDGRIATAADFRGRRVATPQLGNTQDVACRDWLIGQGFAVRQTGGDVTVLPIANPDQLAAFQQRQIDAVWTVEPWVSRLLLEAGGRVFLEEPEAVTTVLAASAAAVRDRRELMRRFVAAHAELTAWMIAHPLEAQEIVREELAAETRTVLPAATVRLAFGRLRLTSTPPRVGLERFVAAARRAGVLKEAADTRRLVEEP